MITDRNGQILAISLPTVAVFADPRQIIDPADAAHRLKQVLPRLDEDAAANAAVRHRTGSSSTSSVRSRRASSWRSTRSASPASISARPSSGTIRWAAPPRRCWAAPTSTSTASPASRGTSISACSSDTPPLRLSLDVRVQAVVRDELSKAMDYFQAIGGCGIVMDVNTGEVLAMVSLPDYDANDFGNAPADDRFNRAVTGMYEPGSTFKLQTASMALDSGIVHIWDKFDAAHDDPYRPVHHHATSRASTAGCYLPEVLAYSSNLGAAHIARDGRRRTAARLAASRWACSAASASSCQRRGCRSSSRRRPGRRS